MPITSSSSLTNISLQQFSSNTPSRTGSSHTLLVNALISVTNSPISFGTHQAPSNGTHVNCRRLSDYPGYVGPNQWDVKLANSEPRTVPDAILSELLIADKAIRLTQVILPFGSANQIADVWRTNTESIHRRRERLLSQNGESLKAIITSGAGNCAEHSKVTTALILSEPTSSPLFRVAADQADHNFVVIGDQREIDSNKVVIADSWVTFPVAHTLDEGKFATGDILEQYAPSTKPDPRFAIDQSWLSTLPADFGGKEKAKAYIARDKETGGSLYEQWTSIKSVGRSVLSDGSAKTYAFDRFPTKKIEDIMADYADYFDWQHGDGTFIND